MHAVYIIYCPRGSIQLPSLFGVLEQHTIHRDHTDISAVLICPDPVYINYAMIGVGTDFGLMIHQSVYFGLIFMKTQDEY